MKHLKKLGSVLLALVMVMALAAPAFADEDATNSAATDTSTGETDPVNPGTSTEAPPPAQNLNDYKITINAPSSVSIKDQTFTAYKVFNVTYSEPNNDDAAFTYTWAPGFETFELTYENQTIAHDNLLTWLEGKRNDSPEAIAFADAALAWAKASNKVEKMTETAVSDSTVTINVTSIGPGYYVVDGAAMSADGENTTVAPTAILTTTNPARIVTLKADVPTVDKKIVEANGTETDGTSRQVGDTVNFEVTSTVPNTTGYTKYDMVFTDTMSSGLTFNNDVAIKIVTTEANGSVQEVAVNMTKDGKNGFTVTPGGEDSTFTITFTDLLGLLDTHPAIQPGNRIVITYSAVVNAEALKKDVETNEVNLEYSNNPKDTDSYGKTPDKTVYVYDFDIVIDKYTGALEDGDRLAGAKFKLKNADGKWYNWQAATNTQAAGVVWVENVNDAQEVETDVNGAASFAGLAAGTYYLIETAAPAGYNKIDTEIEVKITIDYNADGTVNTSSATVGTDNGQYSQTSTVLNNAGSLLPSTGGIGTTIFYIVGGVLVLGAVVLLITKRRTSVDDE